MTTPTQRDLKVQELLASRSKLIRLARVSFWHYCKTRAPLFYLESRPYLKRLCQVLQDLYERKLIRSDRFIFRKLMINIPSRHGKTRTLVLFCEWTLGLSSLNRIICCSYNDLLASDFSRYTRDGIAEEKTYPYEIVFSDIFNARIKKGHAGFMQWALEGEFFNYKGAGIGGSITGKGCNIALIDDPVKNEKEAFNELKLDEIWNWYTGTYLSRWEEGGIEIINMTRWSKRDLCGRILAEDEAIDWYVFVLEAMKNGKMLCNAILGKARYNHLKKVQDPAIFRANYHQQPVDIKGKLYKDLKEWDDGDLTFRKKFEGVYNYTDTADEGDDMLCSITFGLLNKEAFIIDIYYTKEAMEITEPETAAFLHRNRVNEALVESNNGGRGFARAVERHLSEDYETNHTSINWFHQTQNKDARIFSNSAYVINHVYFPQGWKYRYPDFYIDVDSYQREGKNKLKDAPDTLTGVVEMIDTPMAYSEHEEPEVPERRRRLTEEMGIMK